MSTHVSKFLFAFAVCLSIPLFVSSASANRKIEVNIKINRAAPDSIRVEGKFLPDGSADLNINWSFINSTASAENSGERISDFTLNDKNGQVIPVKKFAPGEYLADRAAEMWKYEIAVKLPANPNAMASGSWIDENERGILMLDDLLPQFARNDHEPVAATIKFDLPAGWKIITGEKMTAANAFAVENVEKAIFLTGKNWRETEISNGVDKLIFAVSGDWRFSDEEARQIAAEIFSDYKKIFKDTPRRKILISLARFPKNVKSGRWQAETRGANAIVLSSDMPFKTLSVQRLHEQLRHELFHLWIPNNLALTGNYDWFYEGFTIYEALKTGVASNRIRFEDFLDTLAQAYNIDNFQAAKISLIEASRRRRSGENPQAYARGMIVAFLCDAALLRHSKGRRSILDVFEKLYKNHRAPNAPQDGSTTVLDILNDFPELDSIIRSYVESAGKIAWKNDLAAAGIEEREENYRVRLVVKDKPSGRQRDLLNELGYNNWRKMSEQSK